MTAVRGGRDLRAELAAMFAQDLRIDVPSPGADLLATGRLDSVGIVELVVQLERRFGVRVDMERLELEQLRSLETIEEFVTARITGADRDPTG